MYKAQKAKPINNNAIHTYIQMKQFRNDATFRICCDGSCYWIVNGHQLTEDEFNNLYPLGLLNRQTKGKRIGNAQQIY